MAGQWRALVLIAAIAAAGCVPIPYRPSASVSHVPVTAADSAAITLSHTGNGMLDSLSKSIRHAEPRVVLVDATQYLERNAGTGTLAALLAAREASATAPAEPAADYLLSVGRTNHKQLHDTGMAAPFPYFPVFWVGYEKTQSRESMVASLVDLQTTTAVDGLQVSSTYSEVIASFAYGVGTVAMPQSAMREALARDVAHVIAAAHPTGPIRLVVLAQRGGSAEPEPNCCRKAKPVVAQADAAGH